nr:MAG TPA: hypothetical protein [Caudoviricetes sp.]
MNTVHKMELRNGSALNGYLADYCQIAIFIC